MTGLPQLLGHERALAPLLRAAREGRQHHALLLEGPEGVGKRAAALQLALVGVCEAAPDQRPCGVCKACQDALHPEHLHPDVGFLEPRADRKTRLIDVEQIREVVGKAGYARWRGRQRTWILDPADAMNAQAQNALLKTLEEPNEGTGFILVTSRPRALLSTIRSRCLRVTLTPVAPDTLADWLTRVHGVDAEHAVPIAHLSDGRPGVALQMVGEEGLGAIHARRDALLAALGSSAEAMFDHAEAIGKRGREEALAVLDIIEEILRDVVVTATTDRRLRHPDLEDGLQRAAGMLWPDGVARLSQAVEDARVALSLNVSARAVMDAVLMKLGAELGPTRKHLAPAS